MQRKTWAKWMKRWMSAEKRKLKKKNPNVNFRPENYSI